MEETAGHFDRSVRINEAVGIAELFEVSLDALGSSTLTVVAHRAGCLLLLERTRQRWPLCGALARYDQPVALPQPRGFAVDGFCTPPIGIVTAPPTRTRRTW
jgi:hypothetical protein